MPSLQELINSYINGEDDVDDVTAVPRHVGMGGRRAIKGSSGPHQLDAEVADENDNDNAFDGDENTSAAQYPIFIPSKGRHDGQRPGTCALLARARIAFTVVVEPQEASAYRAFLARLEGFDPMQHAVAVLPASHQGVSYVRNHITRHLAPSTGWFWQMDDDIRCFSQSLGNKKNTPISARAFFAAFGSRMKHYPTAALFSADYEMFAYNYGPGDVAINSYNNIAKLFKRECMPAVVLPPSTEEEEAPSGAAMGASASSSSLTSPNGAANNSSSNSAAPAAVGATAGDVYRFKVREDYDIVLRMIENGYCAVRFRDLSYRVPAMSECSGGMTEYYTKQRADIREQNRLFVTAWPTVAREVIKGAGKDIRFDIKVNWAALNPSKVADPAAVLKARDPNNPISIESLLISETDAVDFAKLREKNEKAGDSGAAAAKATAKGTSWKRGGSRGAKTDGEGAEGCKPARRRSGGSGVRAGGGAGGKRRRGKDSDDDDDDAEPDSAASGAESDDAEFDSDDDEDNGSDLSTLPSSNDHSDDDGDEFEDEFEEDEEAYFALMEDFYNPRKARARERAEAAAARGETLPAKKEGGGGAPRKERVRPPKAAPVPPEERAPSGWAGYAMVMWRDVEPEAAEECGLRHIDPSANPSDAGKISAGSSVAFIPVMFDVTPSVMVGTILSVHPDDGTVQIAPGRKYRGVPLQTVAMDRLYEGQGGVGVLDPSFDPFACAAKLDALLDPPESAVVQVTRSNVKDLMSQASHSDAY